MLALQRQKVFAEESEGWSTVAELCSWLEQPKSSTIMLAKFNCEVSPLLLRPPGLKR